jgi:hypothetical protein
MENLSASRFQEVEVGAHRWWSRNKGNLKSKILKRGSNSAKVKVTVETASNFD